MQKTPRRGNNRLPFRLLLLFASLSLALGIYQTQQLLQLLQDGVRAPAEVVAIHHGARGARMAVLRFRTEAGREQETRDRFQMYLVRHHAGDTVVVLYDPSAPDNATIDIGPWMWQEPAFLLAGFAVLAGLAVLAHRFETRQQAV